MGYKNILIPLDGTEFAEAALRQIPKLAAAGAKIHLLSVVSETLEKVSTAPEMWPDEAGEASERKVYLDKIVEGLVAQGYDASDEVCLGPVVANVSETAKLGYDVVVMATHRRTGIGKFILGSVSEALLHHTNCPTLIV